MRKLLILMLVFGMASVASAALSISVHELTGEPYEGRVLNISEFLWLDIVSDIDIAPAGAGEGYWALVANTDCATISGGIMPLTGGHLDWSFELYDDAVGIGATGLPVGENGVLGNIITFGAVIPKETAIFDQILFHCEAENGPTTVTLYDLDDYAQVEGTWDFVVIQQIPEPATMLLLGLGGLLLRRRK